VADLTHDEARRAAAVALEAQIREDIAASAVSRAGETPDEGRARVKAELGALCERLARAQAAAEGREVVECSSDVTIDDQGRATCRVCVVLAPLGPFVTLSIPLAFPRPKPSGGAA